VVNETRQWIRIASADLSAEIDPLGAQLSTLRDQAGRDLLWSGDASIWAGRAPLLFPVVGALAGGVYRLGAQQYPLSRHGFARGSLFELLDTGPGHAAFRLHADEHTLKVYPFQFDLEVHFQIAATTLAITSWVRNRGARVMPASFGYHPGFAWPLPYGQARAEHYVEFAQDEPDAIRRLDGQGLLTPVEHPTPIVRRRLRLEDALFKDDVIIFDALKSRSLSYGAARGPRLEIAFPDAPYLGIWTKPGAPFICIEPWHGIADPAGFSGDFTAKPGVFQLAPGESLPIRMNVGLLAAQ